jgi:hypothetical protein
MMPSRVWSFRLSVSCGDVAAPPGSWRSCLAHIYIRIATRRTFQSVLMITAIGAPQLSRFVRSREKYVSESDRTNLQCRGLSILYVVRVYHNGMAPSVRWWMTIPYMAVWHVISPQKGLSGQPADGKKAQSFSKITPSLQRFPGQAILSAVQCFLSVS